MKYALVGYGRMGRAIEAAAAARGHALAAVVDRSGSGRRRAAAFSGLKQAGVAVAFEFTAPSAARDNVVALLKHGIPVVCGTTGWDAAAAAFRRAVRSARAGAVIAPNFSIGMSLFTEAVADAARRFLATGGYDPWIAEWHHRAKADAPSGTARRLAEVVAEAGPRRARVRVGTEGGPVAAGEVHVAAVRAGQEPGRHLVGFSGPHDAVTFEHVARGREGFAAGAVLAAEWLQGRRGVHSFQDVVHDLVRAGGKSPRRGGAR